MLVAFWYDRPSHQTKDEDGKGKEGKGRHHHHRDEITSSQLVFVYYTLFAHTLGMLFPLRLIWAIRSMTRNLKAMSIPITVPSFSKIRRRSGHLSPLSGTSESGYEDSILSESEAELSSTTTESDWDETPLLHAIIVPNYKEELDTLRETLDILGSHSQASSSYEVSCVQLCLKAAFPEFL